MNVVKRDLIINDKIIETMIKHKNLILELKIEEQFLYNKYEEIAIPNSWNGRVKVVREALYELRNNQNKQKDLEQSIVKLFMNYKQIQNK